MFYLRLLPWAPLVLLVMGERGCSSLSFSACYYAEHIPHLVGYVHREMHSEEVKGQGKMNRFDRTSRFGRTACAAMLTLALATNPLPAFAGESANTVNLPGGGGILSF